MHPLTPKDVLETARSLSEIASPGFQYECRRATGESVRSVQLLPLTRLQPLAVARGMWGVLDERGAGLRKDGSV